MDNESLPVSSILDEAEASQTILEVNRGPFPNFVTEQALKELKHSIRIHLLIMAGPTQQLTTFLIKMIDFFEDSDFERRNFEAMSLSYSIIEGIALYVQKSIDDRGEKTKSLGQLFPSDVQAASDNILVMVGKSRNLDDKKAAKHAVLKAMADALRALSGFTKAIYPDIYDSSGNLL